MLKQIEGSQAVADVVALCRPNVIAAYPITPQTHIVEDLSLIVGQGKLDAEFVNVESEFSAASVVLGASAAGARTYTATSSQGLLLMAEVINCISGMRLPIVLTCANRAISAPLSIWNDQQDSMALRDAGWIQLFAEDNQEAADLHIQAYKIAEQTFLPVMVCMDGFILTHAVERVDMPTQEQVDAWLPEYEPRQVLDPSDPVSIGAMVGPEAFMEVRYLAHVKQRQALDLIPAWAREFEEVFGRPAGGLVRSYRCEDAETIVVSMGSVLGTLKDTVDELREQGAKVGVLGIHCFRPWPFGAIREALAGAKRVVVVEKSLAVGLGGIVANNVRGAYTGNPEDVHTVVAGLGGRAITRASLHRLLGEAAKGRLERLNFLDLDEKMVQRALERERTTRRSGPIPEGLLRDVGVVAARPA